tara:strand:+ start:45 stop:635 length:591 start_codon:yes stop_codon:yes gene_type:complete
MKRKEIKNEESNTLAAMGIGAMIVFIALILVAAVASAVIIQTAEKLQQNAQTTGDQTQQQMASKISLLSVVVESEGGVGAPPAANDVLRVTFELAPGSENVDPANAVWNVVCEAGTDAGDLTGFGEVSTHTVAQTNAGLLFPGEVYEISITVGAATPGCAMELNAAHYLMFQAGNAGFTYEVMNYGGSNAVGTVII